MLCWGVCRADVLEFFAGLEPDSVDLVFGSPPYEDCRTYGIGFARKGQEWVDWMVQVYRAASRVCRGLAAFVVEGKTEDFKYSCTPALLMADLHRAGFNIRRPCFFHRVGIPGSGGPDWLRGDTEFIVCVSRPGKLPWSDNTAMGHKPRWAPGGEMSYRDSAGARRNRPGRGMRNSIPNSTEGGCMGRRVPAGHDENGAPVGKDVYLPPILSNPGNVIWGNNEARWPHQESSDLIHCLVGGGHMGESRLAHLSEAPYPESLCEFFILSFCPPGGTVCDPFLGSGTTGAVAVRHGRRFTGCDVRASQVKLAKKRIELETPLELLHDKE